MQYHDLHKWACVTDSLIIVPLWRAVLKLPDEIQEQFRKNGPLRVYNVIRNRRYERYYSEDLGRCPLQSNI